MPREAETQAFPLAGWQQLVAPHWRKPMLQLLAAWAILFALTAPDWAAMFRQWWDSSTYNHILLVPAILVWLVVARAPELAKLTPAPWWPGLLFLGAALFIWLLGAFASLDLFRHIGTVGAFQGAVIALFGPRVSWALLFPLSYAVFLVPFGEELVPMLQMITADITIALTVWSGIPAHIDGVFIDTPAGLFEVAEACSGVKFLIAMMALGTLIAHVGFRSWKRRALFMVAAVLLPVLANGVRAWGTIYIAQSQGIEFAAGFDHIFYGWVFFALVMGILLAGAWRFFDRPADDRFIDGAAIAETSILASLARFRIAPAAILTAIAMLVLGSAIWAHQASAIAAPVPDRLSLPQVAGWERADYSPNVWWEPRAEGADHRLLGRYLDGQGRTVDVFLAQYASQREGSEAGGYGQGALTPGTRWRWLSAGDPVANAKPDWLQADGAEKRYAETYYRTGDLLTGSNVRLKLANMRDRLLLSAEPTYLVIISSPHSIDHSADSSVAAFRKSVGPIGPWIDRIGSGR